MLDFFQVAIGLDGLTNIAYADTGASNGTQQVSNELIITVSRGRVLDSVGSSGDVVGPQMGLLLGDVNASGRVDAADVSSVRQQTLQTVTTANFRNDPNTSGRIDAADVSVARQQTLTSLPQRIH